MPAAPLSIEWSHVAAFRMQRHHLVGANKADMVKLARAISGVQVQLMSAAELALWARMRHLDRSEISSALWKERSLMKIHCMRQTLHLLPSADFPVYTCALRKTLVAACWRVLARFDTKPAEVDVMNEAILDALEDGPLTRGELSERIQPKLSKRLKQWMAKVWLGFRPVVAEGLVCYGPNKGQEVTYVRVDRWLGKQTSIPEAEAQQKLLRGFLRAYGPATVRDFAKWSGLPMKDAKTAWDGLQRELAEVSIGGGEAWVLRKDAEQLASARLEDTTVRLLPNFDPYLLAHADKAHLVDTENYKRVYRNQGWISPVILVDGRIAGVWSAKRQGKGLTMEIEAFEKMSKSIRALIAKEAESMGAFLGVTISPKFEA